MSKRETVVGNIAFGPSGPDVGIKMKPMSKAEAKKFKASLDGFDTRLPESAASSDAHLPLPPYKLFRVKDGVMQFRLDETQKWRAVWKLDNDTAYIAMCVARVALTDSGQHSTVNGSWSDWFKHRVMPTQEQVLHDSDMPSWPPPFQGSTFHVFDESDEVHAALADDTDIGGEEADFSGEQRTFAGGLEASPDMMESKLKPEQIEAFREKANAAVLECVLRAAEEIKAALAKHKGDKLPTATKWVDYAMKAIPKSVLVELATGPTMDVLKYRSGFDNPPFHHFGRSGSVDSVRLEAVTNELKHIFLMDSIYQQTKTRMVFQHGVRLLCEKVTKRYGLRVAHDAE